jgi:glutaredoxin
MVTKVTLYSKPSCPLCDDARLALERVRATSPFELEEVDITTRGSLLAEYRERIPVVAIDGQEAFEYYVDEEELERRVAAAPEAVG